MDKIKQFEPFFGGWHVESFIGAGSFGRVYKVYREDLGTKLYSAMKYCSVPQDESEIVQLKSDGMNEESMSEYFEQMAKSIVEEIKLMSSMRGHTNIVSYEDAEIRKKPGGIGCDVFIRMELLKSLSEVTAEREFKREDIIKLGLDMCNALELCERKKIIHRDIKPDNILVNENGDYKLGDFGVARRLERTSTFMTRRGNQAYMAPEVYKGERYGIQADIYSLGLVLYRLLNNKRMPFMPPVEEQRYDDGEKALARRMRGEKFPLPANAQDELGKVILMACEYNPERRFSTATAMRKALQAALAVGTVAAFQVSQEQSFVSQASTRNSIPQQFEASELNLQKADLIERSLQSEPGESSETDLERTMRVTRPKQIEPFPQTESRTQSTYAERVQQVKQADMQSHEPVKKKRVWPRVLVSLLCIALLACAFLYVTAVKFESAAFRRALCTKYDIMRTVRVWDIKGFIGLNLSECELRNINDIKLFTEIEQISLGKNNITDITAFSKMNKLKRIWLYDNSISDIRPLENLTNLEELYLWDNSISDLTPLKKLKNLKELNLQNNYISDPSPLYGLKQLEVLVIGDNCMTEEQVSRLRQALPNTMIYADYQ